MSTTPGTSRNFPTLRYLAAPFRWLFGSRRRVMTAGAVLFAILAAPVVWWSIQLMGLPDIGDPFDVLAFRSLTIPDESNAFVLYHEAVGRLKPLDTSRQAKDEKITINAAWSQAHPLVRRWLEENRETMELYRRGAERPDALDPALASEPDSYRVVNGLHRLLMLALLEASRLEERGDMVGAWGWYRAALRATGHISLRGTVSRRMDAVRQSVEIRRRILGWATDARTTPPMIRRALDDVVECGELQPSDSFTLKLGYLGEEPALGGSRSPGRQLLVQRLTAALDSRGYQLDPDQIRWLADAWRFWRRDPERSRRVMRLVFANWLAYDALPPGRRPKPAADVSGPISLYALGPDAPADARALSPAALDRWLSTADDAREMLRFWQDYARPLAARERANHRSLVFDLATELYRRDHGADPPSDEALVGPYLKELPDDGSGEAPPVRGPAGQE